MVEFYVEFICEFQSYNYKDSGQYLDNSSVEGILNKSCNMPDHNLLSHILFGALSNYNF